MIFIPEIGIIFGAEDPDSSVIGKEVKLVNVINRVTNPEKYSDFIEPFVEGNILWPALLPRNLTSNEYLQSFRFNVSGVLSSNIPLCYGEIYRDQKLTATNYSTLLVFEQTTFNNYTGAKHIFENVFENFSWSHAIYTDYDDEIPSRITLSLRSPIDEEGQIWNGWIMWSYDKSGAVRRFEIIVWRIAAELMNEFDPMTDERSDLTAYYEIVFQTETDFIGGLAFVLILA